MIELPEAVTIARQLDKELRGKRIVRADTGMPHKWVFYRPSREDAATRPVGKSVTEVTSTGRAIHVALGARLVLTVDDFGGRVLYHARGEKPPKKHHLMLTFKDESALTVAIQGWGFIGVLTPAQLRKLLGPRATALSPATT